MKRVHVYISGRVQGVFFRAETQRMAADYNLAGWVRNTEDGRVEALFEGEDADVEKMLAWCRTGPPMACVTHIETTEEPFTDNLRAFRISYK